MTLHYISFTLRLHYIYITLTHTLLHPLHYITTYITLHYTIYINITLHYIHYITLHYIHCIKLHCISFTLRLHYITFTLHLHYIYITFTLHYIYIVAFVSPGGWGFRFCRHKSKNIGGALQNQKHVIWTWTSSIYKILTCNPTWAYTCHPLQIYKIQIIEIHLLYKGIKNWFTKPLKIVSEKKCIL